MTDYIIHIKDYINQGELKKKSHNQEHFWSQFSEMHSTGFYSWQKNHIAYASKLLYKWDGATAYKNLIQGVG